MEVEAEWGPGGVIAGAFAGFAALGIRLSVPVASLLDAPVVPAQEPGVPAVLERGGAAGMAFAALRLALPVCAYRVRNLCNTRPVQH